MCQYEVDAADVFKRAHAAIKRGDRPGNELMGSILRWLSDSEAKEAAFKMCGQPAAGVTEKKNPPHFDASQVLATSAAIVTDVDGHAFVLDPFGGTYRPIEAA